MADQVSARRFPFVAVPRAWLLHLTSDEMKVAIAIGAHADRDGQAYPSVRTLARETNLSPNTIRKCLAGLEGKGVLTMTARRRENGAHTSYLYEIDLTASHLSSGSQGEAGGGSCGELGVVHAVKQGDSGREAGGGSRREAAYEQDPSLEEDPLNEIQVKGSAQAVAANSLPAWDQYGMQFAELPWEGEGRRLDQGFVEHLTQRWSKGREVGDARAMATGFVRKSRRCETDFLRVRDAWELYQAYLVEQREKEQQVEQAKADDAERSKWLRRW